MSTGNLPDLRRSIETGELCRNLQESLPDRFTARQPDDRVRKLFARYEDGIAALDMEKNKDLFAETFMSFGPHGVIARDRSEFLALARQAAEFYKSAGQTSAGVLSLREIPVSDDYSLVKTRWGMTFAKTGNRAFEFDVSYLIQKTGPEPKILLFIAHGDERQAMQELGLTGGAGIPAP